MWESTAGSSEFEIREDTSDVKLTRGTRITLHLKEDCDEYLEEDRLKELIKQYSQFIRFPIKLHTTQEVPKQVLDTAATEKAQKEEDEKAEKEEREAKTVDDVYKTEMETKQEFEV